MAFAALISLKNAIERLLSCSQTPVLSSCAAVISLKHTIDRLLNSSPIPYYLPPPETIQLAFQEIMSLQQLFSTTQLEGDIDSEWAIAMVLEIREAAWTLEGVLEDAQNNKLRDMEIEFDSFTETVKEIKEQLSNTSLLHPEPEDDDAAVSSSTDHCEGKKSKTVGVRDTSPLQIVPIVEMAETIISGYEAVMSIQELFTWKDGNSKRVKAMEREIREAAFRLEDVLESALHLSSSQLLAQLETMDGVLANKVKEEIDFFARLVKKIIEECRREDQLPVEEDDSSSTDDDFDGHDESDMVGLEYEINGMTNRLLSQTLITWREVVSLEGMPGIGKTALARQVYEHPSILSTFDCRLWVRVGIQYQLKKIMLDILAQLNIDNIDEISEKGHDELAMYVSGSLQGRRYLIVLDDIWSTEAWDELKKLFPDNKIGSRILLTTRLHDVASHASRSACFLKHFLNQRDSWCLLRRKVFVEEDSCPPELEEAGKKIAEKCEGLPLAIIVVGKHLSEADQTPEYWKKVAEEEISAILNASDVMSKKLMSSYEHLPQHLKACFLYMGVFPRGYEIPTSKVIKLWCAEGFLERPRDQSLEDLGMECFEALSSRNILLVPEWSSSSRIKTCKLHSVFWYLCTQKARKDEFFHVMNGNANQGIESQHRICIHNNVLFGIKDMRKAMASVSNARSLLCTGPHHQYPVPKCLDFSLLRVLDALTIRFYEFPFEVAKLIYLRYLAFTYNGTLPADISKLQNLLYLIVRQYLSTLSSKAHRYLLPKEIWDMKGLRHLQVMGSDLQSPTCEDTFLPNLSTLAGVSARSCTEEILGRMPSLMKLGIQIELALDDDATDHEPLCWCDHIYDVESLKIVIVNPKFVVPPTLPIFVSEFLKKVTLIGLGFPWEYMRSFAELPWLEVLKLRCYAFRGPVWKTYDYAFPSLRFLLLEDANLEDWHVGHHCFPKLEHLSIQHCYKLKGIPSEFGEIRSLQFIDIVDCGDPVVASAEQLRDGKLRLWGSRLLLRVKFLEDNWNVTSSLAAPATQKASPDSVSM